MKKELLAPAGDIESGYASLYYGADAVYLGLKKFSARATANNFDEQELNEFCGYAHSLNKKVFVTINTVLQENELEELIQNLDVCRKAKVDAVIVQDLGVAEIVKRYYPEIGLHASTQMAVHNKEGALALKKAGFERVVLARELTLPEIKEIAKIKDLDLECFVHGALCYSYSGVCQFSSFESGRSANRGKCLYPCRAEILKDGKKSHCFSMKDMALCEDILKLPIYSLKIEGRKKNALYVAAVVDYYRKILDGKQNLQKEADVIKQIFARPWCKFHFFGKNKDIVDREYVGHRGLEIGKIEEISGRKITLTPTHKISRHDGLQIDIKGEEKPFGFSLHNLSVNGRNVFEAKKGEKVEILLPQNNLALEKGQKIYLASSSEVKGAYSYFKPKPKEFLQKQAIDVEVEVLPQEVIAKAQGIEATLKTDLDFAKDVNKTTEAIKKSFAKTGDVDFEIGNLVIKNQQSLFVPSSVLNNLRRDLYSKIILCSILPKIEKNKSRELPKEAKWVIKTDCTEKLQKIDLKEISEIIFLINENTKLQDIQLLPKDKLRIALPVICRDVKKFLPIIENLLQQGFKKWEIGNYWGLEVLADKNIDLSFDNMIYMFNTQAMQKAKELGATRVCLPMEDNLKNMQKVAEGAPLKVAILVFQSPVLFTSAVCVRDNDCKNCDKKTKWSILEKSGRKYLLKSENCQTFVFAENPFCMIEEADLIKADYKIADFCHIDYSAEQVCDIWDNLQKGKSVLKTEKANLTREVF